MDSDTAMETLRGYIQGRLDNEYSATFAGYGGADVVLESTEEREPERVGRPYIMLALESDELSQWTAPGRVMRDATVLATVTSNDYSGAAVGSANAEGSDTKLARALRDIIHLHRADIEALSLLMPEIRADREMVDKANATGVELHHNPHRLTFSYLQ